MTRRLTSICALLFLTACGPRLTGLPAPVVETRTVYVGPPDSMLVVPAEPVRDAKDTADLIDQLDGYKGSFAACAANLDQVAAWKATAEAGNENATQAKN